MLTKKNFLFNMRNFPCFEVYVFLNVIMLLILIVPSILDYIDSHFIMQNEQEYVSISNMINIPSFNTIKPEDLEAELSYSNFINMHKSPVSASTANGASSSYSDYLDGFFIQFDIKNPQ